MCNSDNAHDVDILMDEKSRREVNQQTKHRPRYLNDLKSFLTTHQGFKISLVILKILGEY